MVRYIFFAVLLAVAAVGCDRQEDPFLREVEKEADRAIRRLGESNLRNPFAEVDKLIETETNRDVRATCVRILQDKLLSVEFRGDDYARLSRTFWWVWVGLMPYRWSKSGQWTIEDECKSKVKQLKWMRRELDQWRLMTLNGESTRLRKENPAKFKTWRRSYRKCLHDYESYVSSSERVFDSDCKSYNASVEERERAKSLLEAFLGRPMRTKAELEKDRRERKASNEMRALQ